MKLCNIQRNIITTHPPWPLRNPSCDLLPAAAATSPPAPPPQLLFVGPPSLQAAGLPSAPPTPPRPPLAPTRQLSVGPLAPLSAASPSVAPPSPLARLLRLRHIPAHHRGQRRRRRRRRTARRLAAAQRVHPPAHVVAHHAAALRCSGHPSCTAAGPLGLPAPTWLCHLAHHLRRALIVTHTDGRDDNCKSSASSFSEARSGNRRSDGGGVDACLPAILKGGVVPTSRLKLNGERLTTTVAAEIAAGWTC